MRRLQSDRAIWWVFLLACLAGLVAYRLTRGAPIGHDLIYLGFGLASASAIVVGVRLHRPRVALAWYLMAAGQLLSAAGDATFSWIADVQHDDRFPTVADVFYLSAYPLMAAGLFAVIRARRPLNDVAGFLDSAILTAALGLLMWVLVAGPTIENYRQQSWLAASVAAAYPAADVVLLGLLIGLVTTPGSRTGSVTLLILAVVVLVVVDLTAAALDLLTFASTEAINVLWLASYALWGAAALHPSMRSLSEPAQKAPVRFSRTRFTALTVAVLVAPGFLAVNHMLAEPIEVWAVVTGSVVISVCILARGKVAIDQMLAATRRRIKAERSLAQQATHDALTGLPNGRARWSSSAEH